MIGMIRWTIWKLRSRNDWTRWRAVRWLRRRRDPRAQAALVASLDDRSYMVRQEAAQALGEIGGALAVGPLIHLIEQSLHYAMTRTAVDALTRVLDRTAGQAQVDDMQAAAMLADINGLTYDLREGTAWFSETRNARRWSMDCSKVRNLAYQELLRRGLIA